MVAAAPRYGRRVARTAARRGGGEARHMGTYKHMDMRDTLGREVGRFVVDGIGGGESEQGARIAMWPPTSRTCRTNGTRRR